MGISNFLKRAFGLAPSDDDDYEDDALTPAAPARPAATIAPKAANPATDADADRQIIPTELLAAIAEVINENFSPTLRQSIDPDRQLALLAERLGTPLHDFIARVAQTTRECALKAMDGDRAKLQTELDTLRSERKQLESKREEQKSQLLSEQRQRRALNDRVRDLEAQLTASDAEKEQYQLEIKSMANKVRVAEVLDSDQSALSEENTALKSELDAMRSALEAKEKELADLAARLDELQAPQALDRALAQRDEMAPAADSAPAEKDTHKRRRGRPRKEAAKPEAEAAEAEPMPDDIDSVDWLLPGGAPASHRPATADPDFGYQPPQRPTYPDSDAQLTLF